MSVTERVNDLIIFKVKKAIKEHHNFSIVDNRYVFSASVDDKTVALLCDVKFSSNSDILTLLYLLHKPEDEYIVTDLLSNVLTGSVGGILAGDVRVSNINSILLSRSNTRIIVGIPQEDTIYVYDVNSSNGKLTLRGKLKGKDTTDGDMFGYSVAANHDASIVVVGAPYSTIDGRKECGSAHVFKLNEQGQEYHEIGRVTSKVDGRGKEHNKKYFGIVIAGGEEITGGGVFCMDDGVFCTKFYISDKQWGSSNLGLYENASIVTVREAFEQLKYI